MAIPSRICAHCATTFTPKRTDRIMYCCRDCAFGHRRAIAVNKPPPVPLACVCCSTRIERGLRCRECSKARARLEARRIAATKHRPTPRICVECGLTFVAEYGTKLRRFCSEACGNKASKRISRVKAKAVKRAATVEAVSHARVFARDGWLCHICGGRTDKARRGTYHPNAPELDHIVPLAKGGAHSYANTACAHRKCNAAKSDTIMGQPSLLAA